MSSEDSEHDIAQLPRPGETIEDRYRLKKVFASGGMGVIMRAEQLRTGRDVAVKILHPHIASEEDFAARFKREVRVATLFDHSSIVRVYDVGETEEQGLLYLVMELLEGRELKDVIQQSAPLRADRVLDIGEQFLDGLAEAHSQEVVHRDLKPANLFISRDRRGNDDVKILDFGIAKLVNNQETQLTETGKITGTPSYMAPEILIGEEFASRKPIDVYASGLIILEMLTGRQVFEAETMAQTLIKQMKKPVPIPDVIADTALGDVLQRATAKHPEDRYRDADAMLQDFQEARDVIPGELRLDADEIPGPAPETSPSLLDQMSEQGPETNLAMLRDVPQHVEFTPEDGGREQLRRQSDERNRAPGSGPRQTVDEPTVDGGSATRRYLPALVGIAAGLVALMAAAIVIFDGDDEPADPDPVATQQVDDGPEAGDTDTAEDEAPQSGDDTVAVHLRSEPDEALIWQDNQVLGRTAVTLDFRPDQLPQVLRLEKEGHEPREIEVAATEDIALDIELDELDDDEEIAADTGDLPTPPEDAEPPAADDPELPAVREQDPDDEPEVREIAEEPAEQEDTTADDAVARYLGGGDDDDDEDDESAEQDDGSPDDPVARHLGGEDDDDDEPADADDEPDPGTEADEPTETEDEDDEPAADPTDDLIDEHL